MKRYRLVDELYLDWIFNCINRGKIYNMVGGSVTHTRTTTLRINKTKEDAIGWEQGQVRARVNCARLAISMLSYG